MGGQSLVSISDGLEAVGHDVFVEGVKEDLLGTLAINSNTDLAAGNVGGGNEVVEGLLVDGLEGTGAGALLGGVRDSCKKI